MDLNSISGFSDLASSYGSLLTARNNISKQEGLADKIKGLSSSENDEELMKACKTFESFMVEQMLQSVEELGKVPGYDDDDKGEYFNMFKDNFKQTISETISGSMNLGIAKMFYDSMRRQEEIVASMDDTASQDTAAAADTSLTEIQNQL